MSLTGRGLETGGVLQGRFGEAKPRLRVVHAQKINLAVYPDERAISAQKLRVALRRLFEQRNRLQSLLFTLRYHRAGVQLAGLRIKLERLQIGSWAGRDLRFFRWRKLGMQLCHHGLGEIALDREDVSHRTVVTFRPGLRGRHAVDQLGVEAEMRPNALHATN